MTCKQCIFQFTYTNGNNWGSGPQSAEVQTLDCLQNVGGKLGCGPQETFRGCSDICIGDFCPFGDQCAKVSDVMEGAGEITTTTTTTTTATATRTTASATTATTTATTTITTTLSTSTIFTSEPQPPTTTSTIFTSEPPTPPPTTPEEKICLYSGIKLQYWSLPGDFYCKSICQGRPESICWTGANTWFICYCQPTPPVSKYLPVIIDVLERN